MALRIPLPKNAIGYADKMTAEELAGKVVDGLSGAVFNSNEDYLNHTSEVTGYRPVDPEHYGSRFLRVQKEALKRGGEGKIKKTDETAIDEKIAKVKSEGIDHKLAENKAKVDDGIVEFTPKKTKRVVKDVAKGGKLQ